MRILIIHPLDLWYPAYKYISKLAAALRQHGDEVCVLAPHEGKEILIDGSAPAFTLIPMTFEGPLLAKETKQQIARFCPDIIHVWNPRTLASRVGLEVYVSTGAKLVVNYEDPEHFHFDTMTAPVKTAQALRHVDKPFLTADDVEAFVASLNWHWILQQLPRPDSGVFLHPLFYGLLNQLAAGFTGIWHPWVRRLQERFRKPTLLMPYATDFAQRASCEADIRAFKEKWNIPDGTLIFLRTGRTYDMVDDQGVMFAAFAHVIAKRPDCRLILCGVDDQEEKTTRQIARFGLGEHVIRPGFLQAERYAAVLDMADIVLCPGFPDDYNRYRLALKIIEYMIESKPMICYASGIGEDLVEGRDALLLDPYTPEHMSEQMLRLANDADLRNTLAHEAAKRAHEWFDVTTLAQRVHTFYASIERGQAMAPDRSTKPQPRFDPNALPRAVLRLLPRLLTSGIRKVALYGAGKHTWRLLQLTDLRPLEIQCIIDDKPPAADINGIRVIHPSMCHQYDFDALIISSDAAETALAERARVWLPEETSLITLYAQEDDDHENPS